MKKQRRSDYIPNTTTKFKAYDEKVGEVEVPFDKLEEATVPAPQGPSFNGKILIVYANQGAVATVIQNTTDAVLQYALNTSNISSIKTSAESPVDFDLTTGRWRIVTFPIQGFSEKVIVNISQGADLTSLAFEPINLAGAIQSNDYMIFIEQMF